MYKIKIEISVEEALNLLKKVDDKEEFLTLFGGRRTFIKDCINLFLENGTLAFDFRETFNEILFEESDVDETYRDVWNEFWYDGLNKFPLKQLIESMMDYKPGKRSDKCVDVALDYILERYYYVSDVDALQENQIEELFNAFEDLDDIPNDLVKYKNKKEFENKLLEFKDIDYIVNHYNEISYDEIKVIKELLCTVADSGNINKDNMNIFCTIIDWHAPKNMFDRKYRDVFVLSIFESNIDWTEEEYDIFDDYFYNVNFDECAQMYQDIINQSYDDESKHISEQMKINPNYRHD